MTATISLDSLLETHDRPFAIIDASLSIVAVNRAYERCFSIDRSRLIGQRCCRVAGEEPKYPCRHGLLFQDFEPYRTMHSTIDDNGCTNTYQISGYPLVDGDKVIYLGELIMPIASGHPATHPKMAGESMAFRQLLGKLELGARANVPVLLQGQTGTGKEVAAEFIHSRSERHGRQMVVVDCTVLGEDLFESEVFGHEKGSFTGATATKKGLFELADQGSLFLDEIGELPLSQQPKLLRALESGTFRRVGGAETLRADVRVISATHRNLLDMVRRGEFREDLYYRLAVFPVDVPSLRERRSDIPQLANFLLAQIGGCSGRRLTLSPGATTKLLQHSFPGNIRELRNVLQLAATLAGSESIGEEHIHFPATRDCHSVAMEATFPAAERPPLESLEADYIGDLLRKHSGNRRLVAAEMNVSERTLYRKLRRYQLNEYP